MFTIPANTTRYMPRHAADAPRPALALARGFRAAIQGLRRAQPCFARRSPAYEPRHAADAPRSALALVRGFRAAIQGLRRAQPRHARRYTSVFLRLLGRAQAAARWIAWKSDQPMTEAGMCLCGAILGLLFGPLVFFCYFW